MLNLVVNGREVSVPDDGSSLLEVLRDRLGLRGAKDGCSPQGQCGCCTVWVDGSARVACVTPARRVEGRSITTIEGLDPAIRRVWADAFCESGASQCGFCTPGIIMRLAAASSRRGLDDSSVRSALSAHLCRCTGWQTIFEAARLAASRLAGVSMEPGSPAEAGTPVEPGTPAEAGTPVEPGTPAGAGATGDRDFEAASRRAELEGGSYQSTGPHVSLGLGGFADDTYPENALVAVPDQKGGWAIGATLREAREKAGKVQGRNSTVQARHPLALPVGDFDITLQTAFVEPAYLELDASWCRPGAEPASALANGGAFGGKLESPALDAARRLADELGRPVRVLMAREDVVRMCPKRPPIAAGVRVGDKGQISGVVRVARTPGSELGDFAALVDAGAAAAAAPEAKLVVEEVDVKGPLVSPRLRAAGWAEAAILCAVAQELRDGAFPVGAVPVGAFPVDRSVTIPAAIDGSVKSSTASDRSVTISTVPGARATVSAIADGPLGHDDLVRVEVWAGSVLDENVLRSYVVGAVHQAVGWVQSEAVAVDDDGDVLDLTVRSFGIIGAKGMPRVEVLVNDVPGPSVRVSDAVFAATAAVTWMANGLAQAWPVRSWNR